MKYTATIDFLHDELGAIKAGEIVEANANQAITPLLLGFFEDAEKPSKKAK